MQKLENKDGISVTTKYISLFKTYIGIISYNSVRNDIANHILKYPSLSYVQHDTLYSLDVDFKNTKTELSSQNIIVINRYDYEDWANLITDHLLINNENIDQITVMNHKYIFVIQSLFSRFINTYCLTKCARLIIDNAYTSVLPRVSVTKYPGFIWLLTSGRSLSDKSKSACVSNLINNMVPHVNLRPLCFIKKDMECEVSMNVIIGKDLQRINQDECPICYEPLTTELLMSCCCRHVYHKNCYDNRPRCIVCNTNNPSIISLNNYVTYGSLEKGLEVLINDLDNPTIYMNKNIVPKTDRKILKNYSNILTSDINNPITLVKGNKCVMVQYVTKL